MVTMVVRALSSLFWVLGCLMLVTLAYTISRDGLPFRRELLTPWMLATLVDFYINIIALGVWVTYKETNWFTALLWIILLVCFGSLATCAFILLQICKLSSQGPIHDPMYFVLVQQYKDDTERKSSCVLVARILFIALGCVMLGTLIYTTTTDGSPFRLELLTPWMIATLIDFYINVVTLLVWVAYKESSWISSLLWSLLFICGGRFSQLQYPHYTRRIIKIFDIRPLQLSRSQWMIEVTKTQATTSLNIGQSVTEPHRNYYMPKVSRSRAYLLYLSSRKNYPSVHLPPLGICYLLNWIDDPGENASRSKEYYP